MNNSQATKLKKSAQESKKALKHWAKSTPQVWDIFLLGDHILACGDCSDSLLLKKVLSAQGWDKSVFTLMLTDPPYGVDYVKSKEGFNASKTKHISILNDESVSEWTYVSFTQKWLAASLQYVAPKNAIYIFNSDKMVFALREGMKLAGVKFAQLLVWVKDSLVIGRMDYLPQHELIAYGWYGKHVFVGSKAKSILTYPKTRKNTIHPTMKPIPLLRELILNGSTLWDTVYDPFGGSGSTLIACEQTARKCVMIELEPVYCDRIMARWEKLTGKTAVKVTP